jgi:peptidoglycan/xylan/chitin deacetylase (PgdA/CDA1 family)
MTNVKLYFSMLLVIIASVLFVGSLNITKLEQINVFDLGKDILQGEIKEYNIEEAKTYSCTIEKPNERTIILRIDDITPWNNLDLMKDMVQDINERGYGVSLGVIPKRLQESDKLIKWLQDINENPLVELSQHGYEHTENEFKSLSYQEAMKKIEVGREIMIRYFGEHPLNFIPPYNVESEGTVNALKNLGFKTLSGSINEFYIRDGFASAGYTATTYKYSEDKFVNADQVLKDCKASLDKNGVCVIMMHPQDFTEDGTVNKEKYSEFIKVLNGLQDLDAEVVNFGQAFCKEY